MTTKERLEHRLKRLQDRLAVMEKKYIGNEKEYTFHGGFDFGYLKGTIAEIENQLDEM